MSLIWQQSQREWTPFQLAAGDAFQILAGGSEIEFRPHDSTAFGSIRDAILVRRLAASRSQWALICPPLSCRVNGERVATGIKCLRHKDEIIVSGCERRLFYSTEQVAEVTTHSAAESLVCPRCKTAVAAGDSVVRCPNCAVVHHEDSSAGRNCWSYTANCTVCRHSTDLKSGYSWPTEVLL